VKLVAQTSGLGALSLTHRNLKPHRLKPVLTKTGEEIGFRFHGIRGNAEKGIVNTMTTALSGIIPACGGRHLMIEAHWP